MARDLIHNIVKSALINDGWNITHDPYPVRELINLNIPTLTWRNFPKVLNFREVEPQMRVFY
jgi:XisH protein